MHVFTQLLYIFQACIAAAYLRITVRGCYARHGDWSPARGFAGTMHTLLAQMFTGFSQNMMIRRAVAVMPKSVGRRTFSSGETYEEIVGM